jgi:hypothetical protein
MKSNPHPATRGQESSDALTMVEKVGYAAERIILRRLYAKRVDGYTLEMSREIARAAIEAMREPTEGMVEEGASGVPESSFPGCDAARVYERMIDAALSDPAGTVDEGRG